eukprot:04117.XXX_187896_187142_1 [CDS] Oithona nana genome sequencing.
MCLMVLQQVHHRRCLEVQLQVHRSLLLQVPQVLMVHHRLCLLRWIDTRDQERWYWENHMKHLEVLLPVHHKRCLKVQVHRNFLEFVHKNYRWVRRLGSHKRCLKVQLQVLRSLELQVHHMILELHLVHHNLALRVQHLVLRRMYSRVQLQVLHMKLEVHKRLLKVLHLWEMQQVIHMRLVVQRVRCMNL